MALAAAAVLVVGVALARWLGTRSEAELPDLALRLGVLLGLPIPLVALHQLTTPRDWPVLRMLGQTARAAVSGGIRRVQYATLLMALVPAAMGATAWEANQRPTLNLAAFLLAALLLAYAGAVASILTALQLMAGGPRASWTAVAGGGAFGPAASAPLLYLPALGLVGGLAPLAVWAAVWTEHPERLNTRMWVGLPVAAAGVAFWVIRRTIASTGPAIHAGLRTAEVAHDTRFLQADNLVPPPWWILLWRPRPDDPTSRFLLTAWYRGWPLAVPAALALPLVVALLVPSDGWALRWLPGCLTVAAVLWWQVRPLRREGAWQAIRWLGGPRSMKHRALWAAALAVGVPGALVVLVHGVYR